MQTRYSSHPEAVKKYDTRALRDEFLLEDIMVPGQLNAVYSMYDRMVVMGVVPKESAIELPSYEDFTKAEYFLERRELGIINVGAFGKVTVDGEVYLLDNKECLYIGKGKRRISFSSMDPKEPAAFYMNSCPAHKEYPLSKAGLMEANRVELGSLETSNERTIYQYIHEGGIQSCQLVMGLTLLKKGSAWNTFPPHTHDRRMETYFYFDMGEDKAVFHFMGEPAETKHLIVRNRQGIISPPWSIHSGAGTGNYSFIWAMAGENKSFTDMDGVSIDQLR
jgi:4-deoxy-L-threo-5-hexosulose-uronate ketol-isomerase